MSSKPQDEKPGAAAEAAAATAPKAASKAPPKTGSIVVRGPAHGRWRADRHFTAKETTINLADLSDEQLKAIEADPVLSVRRLD